MKTNTAITRRSMLATTAVCAAGALGAGVALAADAPADFDESYDVVVIGCGFAGCAAAFTAQSAGANVLLVDCAPDGEHGGNSRFCAQMALYSKDRDGLLEYMMALGHHMEQDPEVVEAFVDGIVNLPDFYHQVGIEEPCIWKEYVERPDYDPASGMKERIALTYPEFPELPGSDATDAITMHPAMFDGAFWAHMWETVSNLDGITVWLESPALRLIQNEGSSEVVGVLIDHEGQQVRVGATNGVVLAAGGFERNQKMIQDYFGVARLSPLGGRYNMGDGIRMAQRAGADLWHMYKYEGQGLFGANYYEVPDGERPMLIMQYKPLTNGAIFCVGDDGSRFINEAGSDRHGHMYMHGVWKLPNYCYRPWVVFDEAQKAVIDEAGIMPPNAEDIMVSASSIEELAALMDVDPQIFSTAMDRFNSYAASGEDIEFGRPAETMRAFEGDTLYAIALKPMVVNTQGGPRRNAKAQIIDLDGNPIPGLFGAGECGGVATYYYQGGGNVADCLVFGQIAGKNAAAGLR